MIYKVFSIFDVSDLEKHKRQSDIWTLSNFSELNFTSHKSSLPYLSLHLYQFFPILAAASVFIHKPVLGPFHSQYLLFEVPASIFLHVIQHVYSPWHNSLGGPKQWESISSLITLQIIPSFVLRYRIPTPRWDSFKIFLHACKSVFIVSNHTILARY